MTAGDPGEMQTTPGGLIAAELGEEQTEFAAGGSTPELVVSHDYIAT